MGPAAESDLLQILDDLHGRFRVRKVFVFGGSMGATSALAFMSVFCVRTAEFMGL